MSNKLSDELGQLVSLATLMNSLIASRQSIKMQIDAGLVNSYTSGVLNRLSNMIDLIAIYSEEKVSGFVSADTLEKFKKLKK